MIEDLQKINNINRTANLMPMLFYSIGFGYLTPFITGGNSDIWEFIRNVNPYSLILFSFLVQFMVHYRISENVTSVLGDHKLNNLYGSILKKDRINRIWALGVLESGIISLAGLLIFYDPQLLDNSLNFGEISSALLNYFLFMPSLSIFVGIFVESKIDTVK